MGFLSKTAAGARGAIPVTAISRLAKTMGESFLISRAGTRSRRPTGFSGLTAGIGRRWTPNASGRERIAGPSWRSISPGCGSLCTPTARLLSEKVTAPVKDAAHLRAKSTILRSKPRKPTPPNGRLPHLESLSGWLCIAMARLLPL